MAIKILHVTDCYDAGVFTAINNLVEATPQYDHLLLFAGRSEPPSLLFHQVFRFPSLNPFSRVRFTHRVMRDTDVSAVHLHSSRAGILGRVLGSNKPIIYQPHGAHYLDLSSGRLTRAISRRIEILLARRTSIFAGVSHYETRNLGKLSKNKQAVLLPNAIRGALGSNHQKPSNTNKVVMSGRVHRVKDPNFFIATASESRDLGLDVEFVWIGAGDEVLESKLQKAGIKVTGWVSKREVDYELKKAAVYFHSSMSEGLSFAILEAAALSLPILVRCFPHYDGYNLLKIESPRDAALNIRSIIENGDFKAEVVNKSKRLTAELALESTASQYVKILSALGIK